MLCILINTENLFVRILNFAVGQKLVGRISLKHIYEIALIKQQDLALKRVPLPSICKTVIGSARSMGIEVVR